MRSFLGLILGLASSALVTTSAFGWGAEGHEAVADIARSHLSPEARAAIVKILGNDDIGSIASWADQVRSAAFHQGPLAEDPDARALNKAFPHNGSWHFVDLPIGAPGYPDSGPFVSEDDVVHAAHRAVAALEGQQNGLTRSQALKVLVHVIGDLHQPLHSTSGYFDLSNPAAPKLLRSGDAIDPSVNDRGGNLLFYAPHKELHAYWDYTVIEAMAGKSTQAFLAMIGEREPSGWRTEGDYHHWVEVWVGESNRIASEAVFGGLRYTGAEFTSAGKLREIKIELPAGYEERARAVILSQIPKAGLRLADLLNHIHWAS